MSLGSALQQAHIAITSPSKLRQRNSSRPAGLCVGQHHGHHDGHFREVKHCLCCSKATTQLQNDVSPASTPYSQLPALKHFPTSHDGAPAALLRKACTLVPASGTAQKTQHAVTHANPLAQPLLLHPCSTDGRPCHQNHTVSDPSNMQHRPSKQPHNSCAEGYALGLNA